MALCSQLLPFGAALNVSHRALLSALSDHSEQMEPLGYTSTRGSSCSAVIPGRTRHPTSASGDRFPLPSTAGECPSKV